MYYIGIDVSQKEMRYNDQGRCQEGTEAYLV